MFAGRFAVRSARFVGEKLPRFTRTPLAFFGEQCLAWAEANQVIVAPAPLLVSWMNALSAALQVIFSAEKGARIR